jgi:hypothetical protein
MTTSIDPNLITSRFEARRFKRTVNVELRAARKRYKDLRVHLRDQIRRVREETREALALDRDKARAERADLSARLRAERERIRAECREKIAAIRARRLAAKQEHDAIIAAKRKEAEELKALAEQLKQPRNRVQKAVETIEKIGKVVDATEKEHLKAPGAPAVEHAAQRFEDVVAVVNVEDPDAVGKVQAAALAVVAAVEQSASPATITRHSGTEKKFVVGGTYFGTFATDADSTFTVTIASRTDKTVTDSEGKKLRIKIDDYDGIEYVMPFGSYSMAPVLRANRRVPNKPRSATAKPSDVATRTAKKEARLAAVPNTGVPITIEQQRKLQQAAERHGWTINAIEADATSGRLRIEADRGDILATFDVAGHGRLATLTRESRGTRQQKVGRRGDVSVVGRIHMELLGRTKYDDPREGLHAFAAYLSDNPAPRALPAASGASLLPTASPELQRLALKHFTRDLPVGGYQQPPTAAQSSAFRSAALRHFPPPPAPVAAVEPVTAQSVVSRAAALKAKAAETKRAEEAKKQKENGPWLGTDDELLTEMEPLLHSQVADREKRLTFILEAHELGATFKTLKALASAWRVSKKPSVEVPPGKFENLSRGRGWARLGSGQGVTWAQKLDNGNYKLDQEGKWHVGSTDGFKRKSDVEYVVKFHPVGDKTWTTAH